MNNSQEESIPLMHQGKPTTVIENHFALPTPIQVENDPVIISSTPSSYTSSPTTILSKTTSSHLLLPSQKRKLWFSMVHKKRNTHHSLQKREHENEQDLEKPLSHKEQLQKNWIHTFRRFKKGIHLLKMIWIWLRTGEWTDEFLSSHHHFHRFQSNHFSKKERDEIKSLILDIGYALSAFGTSSNRVENYLVNIAHVYGFVATFEVNLSSILVSFHDPPEQQDVELHSEINLTKKSLSTEETFEEVEIELMGKSISTYFVKIDQVSVDLDKLQEIHRIAKLLQRGEIEVSSARVQVEHCINRPSVYQNSLIQIFAFIVASFGMAVFLDCNYMEIIASMISGCLIGVGNLIIDKFTPSFRILFNSFAAIVAGCIAVLFRFFCASFIRISVFLVSLSSIVFLLPGLMVLLSVQELMERKLSSGTARLAGTFITILQLGFGVLFSYSLERFIFLPTSPLAKWIIIPPEITYPPYKNPDWAYALAVFVSVLSYCIVLRAPKLFWSTIVILLQGFAAFFLTNYLTLYSFEYIGTTVAALIIGLLANIYSRISKNPPVITSAIGILLIVPGSLGVKSVQYWITDDKMTALNLVFESLVIGFSLVVGLVFAEFIIPVSNQTLQFL